MEDEDKEALKRIADGEEEAEDETTFSDRQNAENPRYSQKRENGETGAKFLPFRFAIGFRYAELAAARLTKYETKDPNENDDVPNDDGNDGSEKRSKESGNTIQPTSNGKREHRTGVRDRFKLAYVVSDTYASRLIARTMITGTAGTPTEKLSYKMRCAFI